MSTLDMTRIPEHVGIIMDGNGRWAKERGMARVQGHSAGMKALKEIVKRADTLGVKYLTVYAFSTENWVRPADEVSGIFKLLVLYVAQELKELDDNNVKVNILGDVSPLPEDAKNSIEKALRTTGNNTGLVFNIAINYGARAEIASAVNALIAEGRRDIVPDDISSRLYTAGMPDPDLIIRTGGEYRLSNFLLWQAAYSELVIRPEYWPDFTPEVFEEAISEYQGRDRRFGGVK
ncbi:MAG: isoprenyl transferase [Firmicutes bacterium]|nr:isoprenyl transferase [Bacillota bacterium]MBQ2058883.1 isoprenyl transferase [Bacillota bacterium]MBQ4371245.1 isoprenyl transferase [Bacillota bacterium]